jgi:hypothetical protein
MRNKLNLKEGEVQRILSLHKNAILKESGKNILNEESTFTLKSDVKFKPSETNPSSNKIRLYQGTKFKVSTKIKNSLVSTRKVLANFPSYASGYLSTSYEDNRAFVVYNCKTKNIYLIGSTNEGAKEDYDINSNKKATWKTGGSMQSLDKLCEESVVKNQEVIKPEQKKLTDDEKIKKAKACGHKTWEDYQASGWKCKKENQGGETGDLRNGTSGNRYTFDFETIMKAIDDTGKCPRSGTSDQAGTSGTSGVQGTQGTSNVGAPVVIQKPTVTKDDFYQWTMD